MAENNAVNNTNTNANAENTALADFLETLSFASKRNGGKNGSGNTATMCANPKTPRLTLPASYLERGYRSGLCGLDADGSVFVVLSKNAYNADFTALHPTQHFITVLGETAKTLRALSYTYTVSERETENADGETDGETDAETLILELSPNGDPKTA